MLGILGPVASATLSEMRPDGGFRNDSQRMNESRSVLDLASWVRIAVLMNVYLDLENLGGLEFWVGGYMSQVREMGKLVYKQPGNEVDGSCHSKEGSK